MFSNKMLGALLGAANLALDTAASQDFVTESEAPVSNDTQPGCDEQPFCDRYHQFILNSDLRAQSATYYTISPDSVDYQTKGADGQITATLNLASTSDGKAAQQLNLTLSFYQNGILRVLLEEPNGNRFRISQEAVQPVVEEQLIPVPINDSNIKMSDDQKSVTIQGLQTDNGDEQFEYTVQLDSFSITGRAKDADSDDWIQTQCVNCDASLWFETETSQALEGSSPHLYKQDGGDTKLTMAELKQQIDTAVGRDVYKDIPASEAGSMTGGVNRAIGLGFWMPAKSLYGLGEREAADLRLSTKGDLYEMWAFDSPHEPNKNNGLYGNMPHVQGVGTGSSEAITWVNSAHTWSWMSEDTSSQGGSDIYMVSESGALELFMYSSAIGSDASMNRNKRVSNGLSTITGFAPMPPRHTLGFHFSKYDIASADIIKERNRNFTDYQFPVDVIVMDIQWADKDSAADGYEYFQFNPQNFTESDLAEMNDEVEESGRFMTTILDPHIKVSDDYFVYADGQTMQTQSAENSIFVKDVDGKTDFEGTCWPGNSVWIDFLNENAQTYWSGLYNYEKFKGSTKIYHAWNDMNEPSVFSSTTKTIPTDAKHVRANGEQVEHREFHNAYGATQQMASYKGLKARDNESRRPFVLTRSFFLGSQKWGGYWTGDNYTVDEEVHGSVMMVLQNGIGGNVFGGADIPGFIGQPSQSMWVRMYQTGMYFPFFRAHCDINNVDREPWIQTQRVQRVIRDAINRRYDMIHYLYTTFNQAATSGVPLMRPMFMEFPDDAAFEATNSQFMLGDSMLVAPKIKTPDDFLDSLGMQEVEYMLPSDSKWYNYYTKKIEQGTSAPDAANTGTVTRHVSDLEQVVYIKGGSIIPILLHDNCMALTKCVENAIRLEVYLDDDSNAAGSLYTDDGVSFLHSTVGEYATISYQWSGTGLTSTMTSLEEYQFPSTQVIDQIAVYGLSSKPDYVLQNGQQIPDFAFTTDSALLIAMPDGVDPASVSISLVYA